MLPAAIVIFREILEIAIIVGVILAATAGTQGRMRALFSGIGLGLVGASIIAFFAQEIADAFDGIGQEIMNATILLLAALMIAWTAIWMRQHARSITRSLKDLGQKVTDGDLPSTALITVIALAVFREGAEIVMFSFGMLATGISLTALLAGGLLGFAGGALVGYLIYAGLVKASTRHIFSVSGWLLSLVAAGMCAKAVNFLNAADVIPSIGGVLWDSSAFIPSSSFVGQILGVLIGYNDAPTGGELLAYILVLVVMSYWLLRPLNAPAAGPHTQQA